MKDWKDLSIKGISKIEKLVAEFDVWAVSIVPFGKYKVRIYEDVQGKYSGYTNLRIKNPEDSYFEGGVGFGSTIPDALEDTIQYFMKQINKLGKELTEEDIEYSDPADF